MIISASRRCDIPRFRFDWFLERVNAGFVDVVNPYNAAQIKRVSLKPEDAEFLVFWTRDPSGFIDPLRFPGAEAILEKYPFYIMVTLTGYPKVLEPNIPQQEDVITAMKEIAKRHGSNRIVWRYDPVLLTDQTDPAFHLKNFSLLASRLAGIVRRVIVSVYDEYTGAKRRFSALEKKGLCSLLPHYTQDGHLTVEIKELLRELAQAAKKAGMEIQSCAEEDLADLGIKQGACIDGELIQEIIGTGKLPALPGSRDKNQRPCCKCVSSTDIGSYGKCPAGCVYCYASR